MICIEYVGHVTQEYWQTFYGKIWEKDQNRKIRFYLQIYTSKKRMLILVYFCQKSFCPCSFLIIVVRLG